jgi:hypothetical protein
MGSAGGKHIPDAIGRLNCVERQNKPVSEELLFGSSSRSPIRALRLLARDISLLPFEKVGVDARKKLLLLSLALALATQTHKLLERRRVERVQPIVDFECVVDEAGDTDQGVSAQRARGGKGM